MGLLESLINGASDTILVADISTGIIIFANSAANNLFECDTTYLVGKHQTQLHPADEFEYIQQKFAEFISSDDYKETTAHILTQNQKVKPVLITSANLFESNGVKYASAYFKDISHLDKLEEIAFEQSHIVRRPIANILGISKLLLDDRIPEEKRKQLLMAIYEEAMEFDNIIRRINDSVRS